MLRWFALGAAGYPLLEILWRGRTDASMALAGGLGAVAIRSLARLRLPLPVRALLGGAAVTAVEAGCGLIWNRTYRVWDYRRMPLNWRGQICLPYTALWCALSFGVMLALDKAGASD